jgi:hypothetical protein
MLSESRGVAHQTGLANGPLLDWRWLSPRSVLSPQSFGTLIASRLPDNDARPATNVVGCVGLVYWRTGERMTVAGGRAAVERAVSFGEWFRRAMLTHSGTWSGSAG